MCSRFNWALPSVCEAPVLSGAVTTLQALGGLDVVRLRRGGSVNQVLDKIVGGGKIMLTGPPGCGKSTKVPYQLADVGGLAVVHLVPHPLQAMHLNMANGSNNGAAGFLGMDDLFGGVATGVVVTSYCNLWSYLLRAGKSLGDLRPDLLLYCDESHESDAGTFSLVRFASSAQCRNRVVLVSATLDGQEFAPEESLHGSKEFVVDSGLIDTAATYLKGGLRQGRSVKVMLFTDDNELTSQVLEIAQRMGYDANRLHSKMEPSAFQAVLASNAKQGNWFCVADSSFRTGFNFVVNAVVDSAEVGFISYADAVKRFRPAFGFELYQAKGRLGRDAASGDGQYVRLRKATSNMITRIEGAEMPLAQALLAGFGCRVPELIVPGLGPQRQLLKNFASMNGDVPINLLPNVAFAAKVGSVSVRKVAKPQQSERVEVKRPARDDLSEAFANLKTRLSDVRVSTSVGAIYCVPGSMEIGDCSPLFPFGARSVMEALSSGRLHNMLGIMSEFDKVFFLRVATFEMTQASIKHIASHRFVTEVGINPAPFSAEQKSLLNKLRSDLAVAEGGYRKLAEILVLMQREAPIDVIELPSAEVEDVIRALEDSLREDFDSRSAQSPGRSALPTVEDMLPGGRRFVELPHTALREQFHPRALPVNRQRSAGDANSQGSSSSSGRSLPEWERRMLRVKRFDGKQGKLISPD